VHNTYRSIKQGAYQILTESKSLQVNTIQDMENAYKEFIYHTGATSAEFSYLTTVLITITKIDSGVEKLLQLS
jgi:hypothetical protein